VALDVLARRAGTEAIRAMRVLFELLLLLGALEVLAAQGDTRRVAT
jgi:hypothetical protein